MTHPQMEVEYALFALRELPMRALRITRRHLPPTLSRDVGVGVFPEGKEILVGSAGTLRIAGQLTGARQLQARQRAHRQSHAQAAMVEDLLKLGRCFFALPHLQIGLAPAVIRINEGSPAKLVTGCRLQQFDRLAGIAATGLGNGNFALKSEFVERQAITLTENCLRNCDASPRPLARPAPPARPGATVQIRCGGCSRIAAPRTGCIFRPVVFVSSAIAAVVIPV
jgi:hypothetical protein